MNTWCCAHNIRELIDELVMEFVREEALSSPVTWLPGGDASGSVDACCVAAPATQVWGEFYVRVASHPYLHHAGELMTTASAKPTITALRSFLQRKVDDMATWQSTHPYVLLLAANALPHESSWPVQALPETPTHPNSSATPATNSDLLSVVAATAKAVTRFTGGHMVFPTPAHLSSNATLAQWVVDQATPTDPSRSCMSINGGERSPKAHSLLLLHYLQQLKTQIASVTDASTAENFAAAAGEARHFADSDPPDSASATPRTPLVFVAEQCCYTIADGLELESVFGAPAAVFLISCDEADSVDQLCTTDGDTADAMELPTLVALREYYAATEKLRSLSVPKAVCRAVAEASLRENSLEKASSITGVESLAKQIIAYLPD